MRFIYVLALVLSFHVSVCFSDEGCVFPDFLQNDPDDDGDFWHIHLKHNGEDLRVKYAGGSQIVESSYWDSFGTMLLNSTCVKKEGDVYFQNATNNIDYNVWMCIEYRNQTDNVIKILGAFVTDGGKCSDPVDAGWPLVASRPRGEVSSGSPPHCPLPGGFLFTASQMMNSQMMNGDEEELCAGHPFPSQLEVDCMPGEGMMFRFASSDCVPRHTGWDEEQKLVCLDSWVDTVPSTTTAQYVLLGKKYFEPLYIMRYDIDSESVIAGIPMIIYLDLALDHGKHAYMENASFVSLNFTQRANFGECVDDLADCNEKYCTHHLYPEMCQKTCNKQCEVAPSCEFEPSQQGRWSLSEDVYSSFVDIQKEKIDMEHSDGLRPCSLGCHEKYKKTATVVKSEDMDNGCRPRYACARFNELAPAVLQYQLGQSYGSYSDVWEICSMDNFVNDPAPYGDIYHSRFMKTLIATDGEKLAQTAPCGLGGNYMGSSLNGQDQVNCTGQLGDLDPAHQCQPSDILSILMECENGAHVNEMNCLSTLDMGTGKPTAIFTVNNASEDAEKQAQTAKCWIVDRETQGGDTLTFYMMPSAQCAEDTLEKIDLQKRQPVIYGLVSRNDSCDDEATTIGSTTTTTASTPAHTDDTNTTTTIAPTQTPTPTPTPTGNGTFTTESQPKQNVNHHVGAIVVGSLVLLAASILGGIFLYRRYQKHKMPYRVL